MVWVKGNVLSCLTPASRPIVVGLMGVVFRVQDSANFYYAYVSSAAKTVVAGIVRLGSEYTPLSTASIPSLSSDNPLTLIVNMTASGFVVTVSLSDLVDSLVLCVHGTTLRRCLLCIDRCAQANGTSVAVTNTSFTQGSVGMLSAGVGWFDDFSLSTSCDGDTQCYST
jgi:hypothetical protein